jgi:hypothetical protein
LSSSKSLSNQYRSATFCPLALRLRAPYVRCLGRPPAPTSNPYSLRRANSRILDRLETRQLIESGNAPRLDFRRRQLFFLIHRIFPFPGRRRAPPHARIGLHARTARDESSQLSIRSFPIVSPPGP